MNLRFIVKLVEEVDTKASLLRLDCFKVTYFSDHQIQKLPFVDDCPFTAELSCVFVIVGGIACDSYLARLQLRKLYSHFVGRPFTEVARREWAVSLDQRW